MSQQNSSSSGPLLKRHPWLPFVLPFAVFMLGTTLEPKPPSPDGTVDSWLGISYAWYPTVYTIKIVLTCLTMAFVARGWREFPLRVSWLAIPAGLLGAVAWIGLCELQWEPAIYSAVGLSDWAGDGGRSAFNPFDRWSDCPGCLYSFLSIRFFGLVVVVPMIEELFLRAFLMRYVIDADWTKVPFGTVTPIAAIVGTLVPVLMHPGELLAALVWFSGITALMMYTRRLWDCVVAHAITNAALGIYVLQTGAWRLW